MATNLMTYCLMITLNWMVSVGLNKVKLSTGVLEPPQLNLGKYYAFYYFLLNNNINFHDRKSGELVMVTKSTSAVHIC